MYIYLYLSDLHVATVLCVVLSCEVLSNKSSTTGSLCSLVNVTALLEFDVWLQWDRTAISVATNKADYFRHFEQS